MDKKVNNRDILNYYVANVNGQLTFESSCKKTEDKYLELYIYLGQHCIHNTLLSKLVMFTYYDKFNINNLMPPGLLIPLIIHQYYMSYIH